MLNSCFRVLSSCMKDSHAKSTRVATWSNRLRYVHGYSYSNKMAACKLRLVQVQVNGESQPKVCASLDNEKRVVDITKLDPSIPGDMKSFLEAGEPAMTSAQRFVMSHAHFNNC